MVSTRTIAGLAFEAVRMTRPVKHWRPRVIQTGQLVLPGVFKGESRRQLWQSMEDTAQRVGHDSFAADMLNYVNTYDKQ